MGPFFNPFDNFIYPGTAMTITTIPGRDLIGYADNPPQVVWPQEARIAVNFCINY
jgi:hypothetical protein